MTATRIYLVRHGQVEGFEQKRYNGQGDVRLTELGVQQYAQLQQRLSDKPVAAVYSSDLTRCTIGAKMLSEPHRLTPVSNADLRELHIGDWQGRTWQELQAQHPDQWQARLDDIVHYQVPGGESLLEMATRVSGVIKQIVAGHPGEEVIVVGHGGVNRTVLLETIGAPLDRLFHIEQNYGCLNIIDYYPDGIGVVKLLNG